MLRLAGRLVLAALLALVTFRFCHAAPVYNGSVGLNGAWLNGPDASFPANIEAGAGASASLSPHISLVGAGFYGFKQNYLRYQAGARVTASDVADKNFNVFLGVLYRGGSTEAVSPAEWAPDAGFGWKPNPKWKHIVVGADASYGLQSNRVLSYVALRYAFK